MSLLTNHQINETDFTKSMIRFQSQYPTEVIILAKGLVRGLKHKPFSPAYPFKKWILKKKH